MTGISDFWWKYLFWHILVLDTQSSNSNWNNKSFLIYFIENYFINIKTFNASSFLLLTPLQARPKNIRFWGEQFAPIISAIGESVPQGFLAQARPKNIRFWGEQFVPIISAIGEKCPTRPFSAGAAQKQHDF